MNPRLATFLQSCRDTVYPEPVSQVHTDVIERVIGSFAAKLPAGATVLDVGCGQGPALRWFRDHGFRPEGIALGEDVRVCRELGFKDCVYECDQNNMPEGWSETLDAVWARHVAEHSPIPLFTLTEYWRVLKPGGWLYLEVPAPGTVAGHTRNPNHYSVFTPDAWGALLEKAGFIGWETYLQIPVPLQIGPDLYFAFTCQKPIL
jgi:SAM-dependent methyltransferase